MAFSSLLSRGKDRFSQPRRSLRRLRPCCSRGRTEGARRTTSPLAVARGPIALLLAAVLADAASSAPVFTAAHFLSGNAQHDDSVAFCNFKPELSEPVVALASSGTSTSPLLCARTFGLTLLHTRALPRCTCSRACTVRPSVARVCVSGAVVFESTAGVGVGQRWMQKKRLVSSRCAREQRLNGALFHHPS